MCDQGPFGFGFALIPLVKTERKHFQITIVTNKTTLCNELDDHNIDLSFETRLYGA